MWGRWLNGAMVAASAALVCSCSVRHPEGRTKEIGDKLAKLSAAARAVQESVDNQVVSPEAEAKQREIARAPHTLKPGESIWVQSGKSKVLHLQRPIKRVSVGNPEIAGIVVLGPYTIMVNAKQLPAPKGVEAQRATGVAIQGVTRVSQASVLGRTLTGEPQIGETTLVLWDGEAEDVHTLVIAGFLDQQVLLEVTVAEINRTAMEESGVDVRALQNDFIAAAFLGGGFGGAGTVPGTPLLPLTLTPTKPTYAFVFPNEDVSVLLTALQTEGLATILAQPKLTALSGQNAVFQVGGEIPIRVSTGLVAGIEFKAFGTLINFVPRVSEDGDILLTVTPEVSEPDFTNEVEGIPTFTTRRASTSTRLKNSETLVIGGLLQTKVQEQERGVPYAKDIPFLGYIFRNTTYTKTTTELLVVVTPHLIHPRAPGDTVPLPTDRPPLFRSEVRTQPDDAEVGRPRVPGVP